MVNRHRIEHNNLPNIVDLMDGKSPFGLSIGDSKISIICCPRPEKRLRIYPITNFGIYIPKSSSFGRYPILPSC